MSPLSRTMSVHEECPGAAPTAPGVASIGGADVTERTCSVDGCERRPPWGSMCSMHYTRLLRYGNLEGKQPQGTPIERVMARVVVDEATGCWNFQGVSRADGYGAVGTGGRGGPKVLAHRLTYEHHVGPVPDGYEVHHECRNRACCNPAHLTAISPEDHRHEHRQDVCANGHDNWRIRRSGERECRTCATDRERRKRAERRNAC